MATLTYDPSNDPEAMEAAEARDQELFDIGNDLEQQQQQLLAGKFEDAEALEAAYIELQKKLGSRNNEEEEPEESEDEEITDEQASLLSDLRDEFDHYGQLTQETAESLGEELTLALEELLGATEPDEEEEVGGTQLNEEQTYQVQAIVGGPESYSQLVNWAAENISEAERSAYDAVMNGGDVNAIYWTVKGLQAQYLDAVGTDGELIQGKAPSKSGNVFRSMAELVRAQADPRYDKDPAYRRDLEMKLQRSGDLL